MIKQLIYPTADISQGEIQIICGVTETGKTEKPKLDLPVFIILGKGSKIERLTGKFILNVEKNIL